MGEEADLGGVATLEGEEAGEGEGEAGDGAAGDWTGAAFGDAALGAGAGAGEAEVMKPKTKTKHRSAMNRAIVSASDLLLAKDTANSFSDGNSMESICSSAEEDE